MLWNISPADFGRRSWNGCPRQACALSVSVACSLPAVQILPCGYFHSDRNQFHRRQLGRAARRWGRKVAVARRRSIQQYAAGPKPLAPVGSPYAVRGVLAVHTAVATLLLSRKPGLLRCSQNSSELVPFISITAEAYNECKASVGRVLLAFASEWNMKDQVLTHAKSLQMARDGENGGYLTFA